MTIKVFKSVSEMSGCGEEWLFCNGQYIAVFRDGYLTSLTSEKTGNAEKTLVVN